MRKLWENRMHFVLELKYLLKLQAICYAVSTLSIRNLTTTTKCTCKSRNSSTFHLALMQGCNFNWCKCCTRAHLAHLFYVRKTAAWMMLNGAHLFLFPGFSLSIRIKGHFISAVWVQRLACESSLQPYTNLTFPQSFFFFFALFLCFFLFIFLYIVLRN